MSSMTIEKVNMIQCNNTNMKIHTQVATNNLNLTLEIVWVYLLEVISVSI